MEGGPLCNAGTYTQLFSAGFILLHQRAQLGDAEAVQTLLARTASLCHVTDADFRRRPRRVVLSVPDLQRESAVTAAVEKTLGGWRHRQWIQGWIQGWIQMVDPNGGTTGGSWSESREHSVT